MVIHATAIPATADALISMQIKQIVVRAGRSAPWITTAGTGSASGMWAGAGRRLTVISPREVYPIRLLNGNVLTRIAAGPARQDISIVNSWETSTYAGIS